MSPLATVCNRHRAIVPAGQRCPQCASTETARENARHTANNRRLGRSSPHWRRISAAARRRSPFCANCGSEDDLTVHLPGGGDHRHAALEEVEVLCRSCHGVMDGGRR